MHDKTIAGLGELLANGDVSSVELTRHALERIDAHAAGLNAFITVSRDEALTAAERADDKRERGEATSLTGIPIAHKDIFCTEGLKTTCGSRILENFVSPYDATVVARLRDAGAVIVGKTNMDEFAMGSSNETSYFGPVRNPWDTGRVPGGSSGGSAAAVAARIVAGATGTDTGGSIRQPAALTGVTGLKPTYGRCSRYGMIAFASSLDQAGMLTQTAEDAALMLQAMAGFDQHDSTSADQPVPDYQAALGADIKGLKVGVPTQFFDEGLDPGVAAALKEAFSVYERLGVTFQDVELPNLGLSVPTYYVVAPAEASSNLSRFDGVRYGHRAENPKDLLDLYVRSRSEGFGEEVKRRIMTGTYVLSAGYYDAYYLQAQKVRKLIRDDFMRAFERVDVLMGPTAPTGAFPLGDKTDDPIQMYLNDIYTIGAPLAGLPAMSVPCGFVDGLPAGLQIIGKFFDEANLLNIGHRYQQETDWHKKMPAAYA